MICSECWFMNKKSKYCLLKCETIFTYKEIKQKDCKDIERFFEDEGREEDLKKRRGKN